VKKLILFFLVGATHSAFAADPVLNIPSNQLKAVTEAYAEFIKSEFPYGIYCDGAGGDEAGDASILENCLDIVRGEFAGIRQGNWYQSFPYSFEDAGNGRVFTKRYYNAYDSARLCDLSVHEKSTGYEFSVYCD
jgi:hypothetical protein